MKKMMLITVLFSVLLSGCAHKPGMGSIGDAITTYVATSNGAVEMNPIINTGDPLTTAIMSIGVKQAAKYSITPLVGEDNADLYIETTGVVASGWNIGVLLSMGTPQGIILAAVSGYIYYNVNQ